MKDPASPRLPRNNLQSHRRREVGEDPRNSSKNPLDHLRLNDLGEDQKEAKTRVPLKQLKRKLSPLVRNDLGVDLENGHNKRSRRSLLRKRVKERPRKNPRRKIKKPRYLTSTSFSSWVF